MSGKATVPAKTNSATINVNDGKRPLATSLNRADVVMPEQVLDTACTFLTKPVFRNDWSFVLSQRQSNLPTWVMNKENVRAASKSNGPIVNSKPIVSERVHVAELTDSDLSSEQKVRAFR